MKQKKAFLFYIVIFLTTLFVDQWSKYMVDHKMMLYQSISVIPGFFSLTYARNTGAAWSMFEGKMAFFYGVTVIALVALGYYFKYSQPHERLTRFGVILIFSGTVGNFIDRLCFQYVRDFLDFVIFGYDFPIFNVADSLICMGVFLMILEGLSEEYQLWKLSKSL